MTAGQAEVVERARLRQGQAAAVDQVARGAEAVEVEARLAGRERDAEVEQLPGFRVDLRVGGEGSHRVQGAVEGEDAAGFQGLRIELPGQPLLAAGQESTAERIDADAERRLQGDAPHQVVVRERSAEGAVERPAGRLLVAELGAADEAGGEADALALVAEAQGDDHAVAVQPVPVADVAAGKASRAVQIVGAAQKGGELPLDPQPLSCALRGDEGESPLQPRGVIHRRGFDGGKSGHPWTPASATSSTSTGAGARRAVRKRAMQGTEKRQA